MNNKARLVACHLSLLLVLAGCSNGVDDSQSVAPEAAAAAEPPYRTILPIPDPVFPKITELDARNAEAPPAFSVTAPEGAPNIVI